MNIKQTVLDVRAKRLREEIHTKSADKKPVVYRAPDGKAKVKMVTRKADLVKEENLAAAPPPDRMFQQAFRVLKNSISLYGMFHVAHWNVTGSDFKQLHDLYGEIYKEIHASLDEMGELIRASEHTVPDDVFTPLGHFYSFDPKLILEQLIEQNLSVLRLLNEAMKVAIAGEFYAWQEFLSRRIAAHEKHAWQLRVSHQ